MGTNIYGTNTKSGLMKELKEQLSKFGDIPSEHPSFSRYLNRCAQSIGNLKIINTQFEIKRAIENCTDHNERMKLMEEYIFARGNKVAVFGMMWGDEGKGKVVSMFSDVDYIVAATGGGNAGHNVYYNGKKLTFHELPGGAIIPKAKIYLSKGRVINVTDLVEEIAILEQNDLAKTEKVIIGGGAQVVFNGLQRKIDAYIEKIKGGNSVGTTKKGIGPAYAIKALRTGITFNMLMEQDTKIEKIVDDFLSQNASIFVGADIKKDELKAEIEGERKKLSYLINKGIVKIDHDDLLLNKEAKNDKKMVFELSQSAALSIDGGGYPFCTSSDTSINGLRSAVNLPEIDTTIGVAKCILTKVGGGRLVTKFSDKKIEGAYREKEGEVGGTTGRDRDIGWLNLVELRKVLATNTIDIMFLTKLDALNTLENIIQKSTNQSQRMLKICDYYKNYASSDTSDYIKIESGIFNSNDQIENIKPEYIERAFPNISLSGLRNIKDLDGNTRDIIDTIVGKLGFQGEVMLGTGCEKDDVMFY